MREIARFENSGLPFVSGCVITVSVTAEDEISIRAEITTDNYVGLHPLAICSKGELLLYADEARDFAKKLLEESEAILERISDE